MLIFGYSAKVGYCPDPALVEYTPVWNSGRRTFLQTRVHERGRVFSRVHRANSRPDRIAAGKDIPLTEHRRDVVRLLERYCYLLLLPFPQGGSCGSSKEARVYHHVVP